MQPSDKPRFKNLMTDALAFYRRDLSTFALSVWWQACQNFDFEQVSKAITGHAMDPERGQFPPMPADIVRVLHGTHTDRALIAWGKVLEAIQRVGAYQSVVFDDGAIHAVIDDMGGWPVVCRGDIEDLPHVQRRFCEGYRTYSRRPDLAYAPRLAGVHERENTLEGRDMQAPMLIGDPVKAQEVMRGGVETGRTAITPLDALAGVMPKRIGRAAA
jgi:hypothetical protein